MTETAQQEAATSIEIETPTVEDQLSADASRSAPPQVESEVPAEPEKAPAYDDGRAALAEKFKRTRVDREAPVPATGDFSDPAQMYGQVAVQPAEPEPPVEQEQSPAPPPNLKLRVRGVEREVSRDEAMRLASEATGENDLSGLTDAQIVRFAQMGAAGESYLNESRQFMETARTRVNVSRQHPDAIDPAPPATEPEPEADDTTTVDPLEQAIEQIQFGDPKEARARLGATIAEAAAKAVQQATVSDRVRQDIVNDLRAHDDFVKNHADVSSDPIASSVIRDGLLNGYREDLIKIGVPAEKIPTDMTSLANHHRQYKLQGQPVRQVATLLDAAYQRFVDWRGGSRQEQPQMPSSQTRVNVNRDERRMAIPQQPSRASVQPMTPQQATGKNSRHDAVIAAQKARGQAI